MIANPSLRALLLAAGITAAAPLAAQDGPSPELAAIIADLPAEQQAFIADEDNLDVFGMTPEKLYILLQGRDAETVEETVAAMIATLENARYQPEYDPMDERGPSELDPDGDFAYIPLNPEAGDFNRSTVTQPPILDDIEREPGPIALKRYMFESDGIPVFGNGMVAVRPEDLMAGGVEVAFVGVPFNLSSGWRDAQHAPDVLRGAKGLGGYDIAAGLDPLTQLSVVDYGDLRLKSTQTNQLQSQLF